MFGAFLSSSVVLNISRLLPHTLGVVVTLQVQVLVKCWGDKDWGSNLQEEVSHTHTHTYIYIYIYISRLNYNTKK